ncbi:unnamed protein product [Bursaphelenchus okinawaensis]|uniref:ZSWIM3 N-terminal domain-containing protein n=1 Tax=Bursaphelenchus okinawaensis TaxID=465554 RepID=A0A811JRE5_9BILA|nr:unnamed protein product [Bursaphelenchus okinawaensis]CAG9079508.1 unnamed protein product [Bursaphelenchus okinawaensis]
MKRRAIRPDGNGSSQQVTLETAEPNHFLNPEDHLHNIRLHQLFHSYKDLELALYEYMAKTGVRLVKPSSNWLRAGMDGATQEDVERCIYHRINYHCVFHKPPMRKMVKRPRRDISHIKDFCQFDLVIQYDVNFHCLSIKSIRGQHSHLPTKEASEEKQNESRYRFLSKCKTLECMEKVLGYRQPNYVKTEVYRVKAPSKKVEQLSEDAYKATIDKYMYRTPTYYPPEVWEIINTELEILASEARNEQGHGTVRKLVKRRAFGDSGEGLTAEKKMVHRMLDVWYPENVVDGYNAYPDQYYNQEAPMIDQVPMYQKAAETGPSAPSLTMQLQSGPKVPENQIITPNQPMVPKDYTGPQKWESVPNNGFVQQREAPRYQKISRNEPVIPAVKMEPPREQMDLPYHNRPRYDSSVLSCQSSVQSGPIVPYFEMSPPSETMGSFFEMSPLNEPMVLYTDMSLKNYPMVQSGQEMVPHYQMSSQNAPIVPSCQMPLQNAPIVPSRQMTPLIEQKAPLTPPHEMVQPGMVPSMYYEDVAQADLSSEDLNNILGDLFANFHSPDNGQCMAKQNNNYSYDVL